MLFTPAGFFPQHVSGSWWHTRCVTFWPSCSAVADRRSSVPAKTRLIGCDAAAELFACFGLTSVPLTGSWNVVRVRPPACVITSFRETINVPKQAEVDANVDLTALCDRAAVCHRVLWRPGERRRGLTPSESGETSESSGTSRETPEYRGPERYCDCQG